LQLTHAHNVARRDLGAQSWMRRYAARLSDNALYGNKSPRGRAPPAIKDGGKENENRRSLAAPPAGSKLKTWIAETL
jgi:hypothetical protein